VDAGSAAELPHRIAQSGLDERVDHHGGTSPGRRHRELEIVDGLDAWVADLVEALLRELRLEREHEPRRGLPRRVRDDVELNGCRVGAHAREGIRGRLRSLT